VTSIVRPSYIHRTSGIPDVRIPPLKRHVSKNVPPRTTFAAFQFSCVFRRRRVWPTFRTNVARLRTNAREGGYNGTRYRITFVFQRPSLKNSSSCPPYTVLHGSTFRFRLFRRAPPRRSTRTTLDLLLVVLTLSRSLVSLYCVSSCSPYTVLHKAGTAKRARSRSQAAARTENEQFVGTVLIQCTPVLVQKSV
jgi:hypothetical protein